jgi:hypothetical protein
MDFICPVELSRAVAAAAAARMESKNSWLRMACVQRLRQQHDEMRSDGAAVISSVGNLAAIEQLGGRAKSGNTGMV